jgi:hypothetical protein
LNRHRHKTTLIREIYQLHKFVVKGVLFFLQIFSFFFAAQKASVLAVNEILSLPLENHFKSNKRKKSPESTDRKEKL